LCFYLVDILSLSVNLLIFQEIHLGGNQVNGQTNRPNDGRQR
jgi:hypothetical protein